MKRPYIRKTIPERIEKAITASRTALNRSRKAKDFWSESECLNEAVSLLSDAIHLITDKIKANQIEALHTMASRELADEFEIDELRLLKQLKITPGTAGFFADKSINERLSAIWQKHPTRLIRFDRDGVLSWMLSESTWAHIDDAVFYKEFEPVLKHKPEEVSS